ncbi:MAG: MEKHLA domain-containing protein [Verrucomicrobiota bacterium]
MSALEPWAQAAAVARVGAVARSLAHWTGRELLPGALTRAPEDLARRVFEAPWVLVAHGTEADPVLDYGNRTALDLWELSWEALTRMPSRYTAEAPNREERARLLETVGRQGYLADYSGVRISSSGRRFRIARALVWNVLDAAGRPAGQAAWFDSWDFLPAAVSGSPG